MWIRVVLFSLLLGIVPSVRAADLTAESASKVLTPFLNDQVVAVGRVDVARFDLNGYLGLDDVVTGSVGRSLKRIRPIAADLQKQLLSAGAMEIYVVHAFAGESFGPFFMVVPLTKESKAADIGQTLSKVFMHHDVQSKQVGESLLIGTKDLVTHITGGGLKPIPRAEFAAGLAAGQANALNIVVSLSPDQRRVLTELLPLLSPDLGGAALAQVVQGTSWVSVALDISAKPRGQLIANGVNPLAAKQLSEFVVAGLKKLAAMPRVSKPVQAVLTGDRLAPQVAENRVVIDLNAENLGVKSLTSLLTDLTGERWDNTIRFDVRNDLKQLGLAFHNFNDSDNDHRFPPAISQAKEGQARLSWRVQILPFIDPQLYARYDRTSAWDSEHNLKLLKEIPDVYATLDQDRSTGLTRIQMPINKGMMGGDPLGLRIKDVSDGLSNTILLLQVDDEHAVPWTKPQDFEVDLMQPWKGIVAADEDGIWSVLMDGSARFWSKTNDADRLLKMLTISGGEGTP